MRRLFKRLLSRGGTREREPRIILDARAPCSREAAFLTGNGISTGTADIRESARDPLDHFVEHGARERRDPGPGFDTTFYVAQNPTFAETGLTPLEHYLRIGRADGAAPVRTVFDGIAEFRDLVTRSGFFEADWYLAHNPDVRRLGIDPLDHLIGAGGEGMAGSRP